MSPAKQTLKSLWGILVCGSLLYMLGQGNTEFVKWYFVGTIAIEVVLILLSLIAALMVANAIHKATNGRR